MPIMKTIYPMQLHLEWKIVILKIIEGYFIHILT